MNHKPVPNDFMKKTNRFLIPVLGDAMKCNVPSLANEHKVDVRTLRKWMKQSAGMTAEEYICLLRLEVAGARLRSGRYATVKAVRLSVGMMDESWFNAKFRERYRLSPSVYMQVFGAADADLQYV